MYKTYNEQKTSTGTKYTRIQFKRTIDNKLSLTIQPFEKEEGSRFEKSGLFEGTYLLLGTLKRKNEKTEERMQEFLCKYFDNLHNTFFLDQIKCTEETEKRGYKGYTFSLETATSTRDLLNLIKREFIEEFNQYLK